MPSDEIHESLRIKYPKLMLVEEVLSAHRNGRPITTRCPECGAPLVVTEIAATNALVISCENGHTLFHAMRKQ
jgi:ribosomal protein S27E